MSIHCESQLSAPPKGLKSISFGMADLITNPVFHLIVFVHPRVLTCSRLVFSAVFLLRSVPPVSMSSKESSTRSRTQNKTPLVVMKKEQLALMNPAIRFIDHMEATQRGGLPPIVSRLWRDHLYPTLTQPDYLPPGLKVGFYLRYMVRTLFFRDLINWLSVRSV